MRTAALLLTVLLAVPGMAHAYLHFANSVGGRTVSIKWSDGPVRWFAKDSGVPGVSASDFQAAVSRAFATWQDVPTASISFQFVGFTGAEPLEDDGISVIGFQNHPEMDRVLGATSFLVDVTTGEILEADIFFNSAFPWSTSSMGDAARVDLESVAVHEVGHFLGLGHSALGETEVQPGGGRRVLGAGAVMFPIAFTRGNTLGRDLQPDDVAGVSDLYPDNGFRQTAGVVRGRVVRNGRGVFGAHVVAFNPRTGALVGAFTTTSDGAFQIGGLSEGAHVVRVEPLDDADGDSFFESRDPVDVGFRVTFHDRLVVAPAGGVGDEFTVVVAPK